MLTLCVSYRSCRNQKEMSILCYLLFQISRRKGLFNLPKSRLTPLIFFEIIISVIGFILQSSPQFIVWKLAFLELKNWLYLRTKIEVYALFDNTHCNWYCALISHFFVTGGKITASNTLHPLQNLPTWLIALKGFDSEVNDREKRLWTTRDFVTDNF